MKSKLLTSDAEKTRYSLTEAERMLPLIEAIAAEFVERTDRRRVLLRKRRELDGARTPEGVVAALADLDAEIWVQTEALRHALDEFTELGMTVLRHRPLTVHIPGRSVSGPLVFCWQAGDSRIEHGHPIGEEDDPRRPLRVREPKGLGD